MKTLYSAILVLLSVGVIFFASGCNRQPQPNDLPKLYRRSIKLVQENKPLADASVFLAPLDDSKWNAGGSTDASGVATLYTHGLYQGVPAGKYKVIIDKNEIEVNSHFVLDGGQKKFQDTTYSLVDLKYTKRDVTPLELEVSGKNETPVFDLGPAVRARVLDEQ